MRHVGLIILIFPLLVKAQNVTIHFEEKPLYEVLSELQNEYSLEFSYSSQYIDLQHQVSSQIEDVPLENAVEQLFDENRVTYRKLASKRYALRMRNEDIGKGPDSSQENREELEDDQSLILYGALPSLEAIKHEALSYIPDYSINDYDKIVVARPVKERDPLFPNGIPAKIDLIPSVSTESFNPNTEAEKFSLNLLWGATDSLDGVELGTFFNKVKHNAKGVQAAGIGNHVEGNLDGIQIAGFFNSASGQTEGVQLAGLANKAGEGNYINQFSTISNSARGIASFQASVFRNKAETVNNQLSVFINKADHVKKMQIGLFNIADTVDGATIGLFNFVKKGYNHFELSANEVFAFNGTMRFGSQKFHSILSASYTPVNQNFYRWGVGIGVGSRFELSEKSGLNLALTTTHVNENRAWQNQLNLLNTFSVNYSHRLMKGVELFAGPSFTAYVYKSDPTENVNQYALQNKMQHYDFKIYEFLGRGDLGNNNVRLWLGFTAGIRF